jgi:hypothetical protein
MIQGIKEILYLCFLIALISSCCLIAIIGFRRSPWWGSVPYKKRSIFAELDPFDKKILKLATIIICIGIVFFLLGSLV